MICPSVCLSVYLFICLSVWLSFCFISLLISFFFFFSYLFSYERLAHMRTHTYIWIYVPSDDWYILLKKTVSEESYSSDCIISYLISFNKITIIILLLWYYLDAITIHWIRIIIVIVIVVVIVITCNESMYISSCLVLSCLVLSWV